MTWLRDLPPARNATDRSETERRREAEAALVESQHRIVNVLEMMPAAFVAMDHGFRIIFVNEMAEVLMRSVG